jgi:hypothetical protein
MGVVAALGLLHAAVSSDHPLRVLSDGPRAALELGFLEDSTRGPPPIPVYHPHRPRFRCPPAVEGRPSPRAYIFVRSPPSLPLILLDRAEPKAPYPVK